MKTKIYLFMLILLSVGVIALEPCINGEYVKGDYGCTVYTPTLLCVNYTYDLLFNGSIIESGALINYSDNIFMFNFTRATEGVYIARLCDNSTRELIVYTENDTLSQNVNTFNIFLLFILGVLLWFAGMFIYKPAPFLLRLLPTLIFFICMLAFTGLYRMASLLFLVISLIGLFEQK